MSSVVQKSYVFTIRLGGAGIRSLRIPYPGTHKRERRCKSAMFYRSDRLPLASALYRKCPKTCVFDICGGAVSSFVPLRSLILPVRCQWRCAGGFSGQSLMRSALLAVFLPSLDATFGGINVCKLFAEAKRLGGGLFCHVGPVVDGIWGHQSFLSFAGLIYPRRFGWRVGFRPGTWPKVLSVPRVDLALLPDNMDLNPNPKQP